MKQQPIYLAIWTIFCLITTTFVAPIEAQSLFGYCGREVVYNNDSTNLTWQVDLTQRTLIIMGNGPMKDYSVDTKAPWYDWPNRRIKAIIIDDGVSYIGAYAFADCEGVESVTLPESLTEIARGAFSGSSVPQITIPANVTKIGEDAFYGCNFLHNIYMYADVASLTWTDNENPDFSYYGTACHVNKADREAFANKFNFKHLTFWGDLDQIDGPWISGDCEVELNKNGTLTVSKNGSDSEGRIR